MFLWGKKQQKMYRTQKAQIIIPIIAILIIPITPCHRLPTILIIRPRRHRCIIMDNAQASDMTRAIEKVEKAGELNPARDYQGKNIYRTKSYEW